MLASNLLPLLGGAKARGRAVVVYLSGTGTMYLCDKLKSFFTIFSAAHFARFVYLRMLWLVCIQKHTGMCEI